MTRWDQMRYVVAPLITLYRWSGVWNGVGFSLGSGTEFGMVAGVVGVDMRVGMTASTGHWVIVIGLGIK